MNDTISPSVSIIVFFARYKYKIILFTATLGLAGAIFQFFDKVYFQRSIAVGEYISNSEVTKLKLIENILEKPVFIQMFSEKIIDTLEEKGSRDILRELDLHLPHGTGETVLGKRLAIYFFVASGHGGARLSWDFLLRYRSEKGRIYLDSQFPRNIDLRPLVYASVKSIKLVLDKYKKYERENIKKQSDLKQNRMEAKVSQIVDNLRGNYKNLLISYHRSSTSLDDGRFPYDLDIDNKSYEATSGTFSKFLQLLLFKNYLASLKKSASTPRKNMKKGEKDIFEVMSETLSQAEKTTFMSDFLSRMAWESIRRADPSDVTFAEMENIFVDSVATSGGVIIRRFVIPSALLFSLLGLFISLGTAITYEVFFNQNSEKRIWANEEIS